MIKKLRSNNAKMILATFILSAIILPVQVKALENEGIAIVNQVLKSSITIKKGVVTANALNVRKGAGTSYSKIGTLSKGSTVQIVGTSSNGWYKIKYKTTYGYVSNKYIKITTSNETTIKYTGVTNSGVNIRSGASKSYSKIGYLKKGTKVDIITKMSNGWYKIKLNSGYGYVYRSYINIDKEIKNLNNFLFVGDSFTVLMKDTIKSKNSNVYIHAKSGSMPGYWLDKVSTMPSNSKVDGIVLLIGVNGAGYESNKSHVKALINKLSARYQNKTIYVQKVFPVGRAFKSANPYSFNQKISGLNNVIQSHCKVISNAKFIDTTSGFVDSDGYLIHHNGDGLHIASKYNNQFYNNIFNAIKKSEK